MPDDITSPDNLFNILKHIIEICLSGFSKTIESFHVQGPYVYSAPIDFEEINDGFYNIVEMHIDPSMSVEPDTLLCTAPRLRSLGLGFDHIKLKGELYNLNRFGLQSFKVVYTSLTSDVLRFLSFHCRSLNELDFQDSSVYGNCTTPGNQSIDMTYI